MFSHLLTPALPDRRLRRSALRPSVEPVEARRLLTTFLVTTTADTVNGVPGVVPGSLREAILNADADPSAGIDTIAFALSSDGGTTIAPAAALPPITRPVVINGTTQAGYQGTPIVILDGRQAGPDANGLTITGSDVTIKGLAIGNFSGSGLFVAASGSARIQGNLIGLGPGTGSPTTLGMPNGGNGIFIVGRGSTVGGVLASDRNVISDNGLDGIRIENTGASSDLLPGGSANTVLNNFLGTDATGNVPLANTGAGVSIIGGSANVIGGTPGNRILDNHGAGIDASGAGVGNTFLGNFIGFNGNGVGIRLTPPANNGQTAPQFTSVASFNGVTALGGTVSGTPNSTLRLDFYRNPAVDPFEAHTLIDTTEVTTGADGTGTYLVNLPAAVGAFVTATTTDPVNGTSALSAIEIPLPLVVTNTNDSGIGSLRAAVTNANNHPNTPGQIDTITFAIPGVGPYVIGVGSPLIVTDPVVIDGYTQAGSLPNTSTIGDNARPLVVLDGGASATTTANAQATGLFIEAGGSTVEGLVVGNFAGAGLYLSGFGGDRVVGNFLGTDATGTLARPNLLGGLLIGPGVSASGNTIGGIALADRNLISGNNGPGVYLFNGTTGNTIEGNLIGTDASGTRALGNADTGVLISNAPGNLVGGSVPGSLNVISGNRAVGTPAPKADPATTGAGGVVVIGPFSTFNTIEGNLIGTSADGESAVGNAFDGVGVSGASDNLIRDNVISGNGTTATKIGVGVRLAGSTATGNVVQGNRIGTDALGLHPLGNATDGVFINAAPGNLVGGLIPGTGNIIAANGYSGVDISGRSAGFNLVAGNVIGLGVSGAPLGNSAYGVVIQDASGNAIGGTQAGAGNFIANNKFGNIAVLVAGFPPISNPQAGNLIAGNALPLSATVTASRTVTPRTQNHGTIHPRSTRSLVFHASLPRFSPRAVAHLTRMNVLDRGPSAPHRRPI